MSRLVSSQKERDFVNTNYDDIKQVFSIWICMNMASNSMSHIHLIKDEMLEPYDWKGNMDLLNIVLIGITDEFPQHDEKYELHRLIGTLLSSGLKEQEKLDMATLLLYRLLEMIEQKRLAGYNLYVSKMNYKEIKVNTQIHPEWDGIDAKELFRQIKERYLDMKIQLFGKTGNTYMPEQISLLEGFILLAALDDEMLVRGNSSVIDKLKRIRAMVYLRNNSIFAHGLGPVSQTDYLKFKSFVLELFREFCDIEQINFAQYNSKMTWITPFDSVYYSGLEGN